MRRGGCRGAGTCCCHQASAGRVVPPPFRHAHPIDDSPMHAEFNCTAPHPQDRRGAGGRRCVGAAAAAACASCADAGSCAARHPMQNESILHTMIAATRASALCTAVQSQQCACPLWRLACCFGGQSLCSSAEGNARVPCLLPACRLHAHGSERGGQGHLQPERRARLVSVGERCSTWPLVQMCGQQPPTNWAAAVHQRRACICASTILCRSQLDHQPPITAACTPH